MRITIDVARRVGSDGSISASGSAGPGFDPQRLSKFSFENFQPPEYIVQLAKWITGKRKQPRTGHLLVLSPCGQIIEIVREVTNR